MHCCHDVVPEMTSMLYHVTTPATVACTALASTLLHSMVVSLHHGLSKSIITTTSWSQCHGQCTGQHSRRSSAFSGHHSTVAGTSTRNHLVVVLGARALF